MVSIFTKLFCASGGLCDILGVGPALFELLDRVICQLERLFNRILDGALTLQNESPLNDLFLDILPHEMGFDASGDHLTSLVLLLGAYETIPSHTLVNLHDGGLPFNF